MTERLSVVYFALDAAVASGRVVPLVKIGVTTDLRQRMRDLAKQTMSGQSPIVLALEEGGLEYERELHRLFAEEREAGEWFRYSPTLQAYIQDLEHPVSFLLVRPLLRGAVGRGWPHGEVAPLPAPPPKRITLSLGEARDYSNVQF